MILYTWYLSVTHIQLNFCFLTPRRMPAKPAVILHTAHCPHKDSYVKSLLKQLKEQRTVGVLCKMEDRYCLCESKGERINSFPILTAWSRVNIQKLILFTNAQQIAQTYY